MTTVLLILVLAGLVGTCFMGGSKTVRTVIRVGLCVFAVALSVSRCRGPEQLSGSEVTTNLHYLVGWKLGQLLAEELPPSSEVVVVQMAPASTGIQNMIDAEARGLTEATKDLDLVLTFPGRDTPDSPDGTPMQMGRSAAGALKRAARDAAAIVAFSPVPLGALEDAPPIYLLDSFSSRYWKNAMKQGLVHAAIVPKARHGAGHSGGSRGGLQERFDQNYDLFTAETETEPAATP